MLDWKEFFAGGFAGTVSLVAGHPMDTVKVLVQNSPHRPSYFIVARDIHAHGLLSFFRGLSLPVFSYASVNAVIFGAYQSSLKALGGGSDDRGLHLGRITAAGLASGVCQSIINVPVEVVKVKLQKDSASLREFRGPVDCVRHILKKDGVPGLYQGLVSSAGRDIIGVAVMFVVYEWSMERLKQRGWSEAAASFTAGGIGGLCSWGSIVPLDVVKTRAQSLPRGQRGQVELWKDVLTERAWSRGIGALLSRAIIVNAITFYVYELTMKAME